MSTHLPPHLLHPDPDNPRTVDFAEINVPAEKLLAETRITSALARTAEWRQIVDFTTQDLVLQLRATCLSSPGTMRWRIIHAEPATWWDRLKADHAPAWYRRRHPIRETFYVRTIEFDGKLIFPGHEFPKQLGPARLIQFDGGGGYA